MAARIATEAREVLGVRSKVRNPGIHRSSRTLHQCGQAPTPIRFARSFEHEPRSLLDQVFELTTPHCRLRLGPAVEIIRDFDRGLHCVPICHKTINPYLRRTPKKGKPYRPFERWGAFGLWWHRDVCLANL